MGDTQRQLAGIHVLVVDDDPDARDVFDGVLRYLGALVTTVDGAAPALEVLERVVPDVVVTDLAMPKYSGVYLLERIREYERNVGRRVPVIAVTASQHSPSRLDFDAYLVKPVNLDGLCAWILRLVRRRDAWPPPRRE